MSQILTVKILGSGCSSGVPRIDGYWGACDPENPKNRRTRCSAWFGLRDLETDGVTSVAVDTSPEFREQMLRAQVKHLDAILWTHDHADQAHGLDDMRAYTFTRGVPIDGYMDEATHETFLARFGYVFAGKFSYPPICVPHLIPPHGTAWGIEGAGGYLPLITYDQEHGPIRSVGYRIGDVAYSSDVNGLPDESFEALQGVKVWIVDALRRRTHPTHAHLDLTLEWISRVKPQRAILTNLHHDMDYDTLKAELPNHVEPAYDQMTIEIDM